MPRSVGKGRALDVVYLDFSKTVNTVSCRLTVTILVRYELVNHIGGKLAGPLGLRNCDQ